MPQFPNGRLEQKLKDLGFSNVMSLEFGKRWQITKDFYITIYEPASLWNDSQALFEINSFRILNINDAGINHRIYQYIKNVDCICAAFSPGASGYPATYTHLSDKQKIDIYERSRLATLEMLKEACKKYKAKYFIPFASHFILNHPQHEKYVKIVRKNTIYDCIKAFSDSKVEVIAMLNGDSWDVKNNIIHKIKRDRNLYEEEIIKKEIIDNFDIDEFMKAHPEGEDYIFDKESVLKYFENLNKIPEMVFCEDLSVSIYPDSNPKLAFSFIVENGNLQILPNLLDSPNLTMKIPSHILMYIVKNNESWDEATIGYWCEFSRNPDLYHAEFWRILQTPYYLKNHHIINQNTITAKSNIAEIIEKLKDTGNKILNRYGLYCLTCHKAPMETIEQACNMHGIDESRMNRMIKELNIFIEDMKA